jgi:uncharacterized protein YrzB (UPF0473 family)
VTEPQRIDQNGAEEIDEEYEIVTLVDQEGTEQDFAIMDEIDVDGDEYAILAPVEALESTDPDAELQVVVLRIDGDDLLEIEDDAEAQRVAARLAELANEA